LGILQDEIGEEILARARCQKSGRGQRLDFAGSNNTEWHNRFPHGTAIEKMFKQWPPQRSLKTGQ
jgi:hypothetical protein